MLNWFPYLPERIQEALFPLSRWLHIVCTCLLVGGTLFYEFIIPKAIEDLKEETQLAVLGRVRWFFGQVVILSALILVVTGSIAIFQQWRLYSGIFHEVQPWILLHIGLGLFALIVGVVAMARTRAPRTPLTWLRVNFVILLIVIFVAAVSRHMRMMVRNNAEQLHLPTGDPNPSPPP
jgi:uncharacterized membrane protein